MHAPTEPPLTKSILPTEKFTVPFPAPLEPDVIVIKLSPETAVQLQPPGAVTVKLPIPPELGKFWLVGPSEVTQAVPSKKLAIFGYVTLNRP